MCCADLSDAREFCFGAKPAACAAATISAIEAAAATISTAFPAAHPDHPADAATPIAAPSACHAAATGGEGGGGAGGGGEGGGGEGGGGKGSRPRVNPSATPTNSATDGGGGEGGGGEGVKIQGGGALAALEAKHTPALLARGLARWLEWNGSEPSAAVAAWLQRRRAA